MDKKYKVSQLDSNTYLVVEIKGNKEVAVLSNYPGRRDAKKMANLIAALLNKETN